MNNTLSLMASFALVVKTGSFTRAASRLGLSKSVVSRHVSALEKELGVQLLYRSTHRLSPTEAGERFYDYCRDLDQVVEQATAVVTASQENPRGLLRITLPQTLVVSPIGKMIARFQARYPDVQLDVRVTSLQVDPIEEAFDLALRIGELEDSNLLCRKLADMRMLAVATPAYVKLHGKPRSEKELGAHHLLSYSEFGSRARSARTTGARRAAATQVSLSTNSGVLLMHALLAGQGIVVGPELMFEPHLQQRELVVVLDAFPATALYAVFPPGRFPTAARKAFVAFLIAALNDGRRRA
ncbi:MAG: LysR family transcriptional regulator [Burkholderiales bacterium]